MRRLIIYFIFAFSLTLGLTGGFAWVSNVKAASQQISLKTKTKTLYIGGCKGHTKEGKKAKYKAYVNVRKIIDGFDLKTYDIILKTASDVVAMVDNGKDRIYAEGVGETEVTVIVKSKKNNKRVFKSNIKIVVKQNADQESFVVKGLDDDIGIYDGDSLIVSMPGDYTDKRTIICDDDGIEITPLNDGISFSITFIDPGEYKLTAASYQSKKYSGFTAQKELLVTVKEKDAELVQLSSNSILLSGGPVHEDMEEADISLYEIKDGVELFYSYTEKLIIHNNEAEIVFFEPFDSEKEYIVKYDGLGFKFLSAPSTKNDVASFEIVDDAVRAGQETKLEFRFYNYDGVDITAVVGNDLSSAVSLNLYDESFIQGYVTGRKIYFSDKDLSTKVTATLKIAPEDAEDKEKIITSEKVIKSLPQKGSQFSGEYIYTIKQDNGNYLKTGDTCVNYVPLKDSVVLEALFKMDDGTYKNFDQAGITNLLVSNMTVLMVGEKTSAGGYKLILNNEGNTHIIAFSGDETVGSFDVTVGPARIPSELRIDLSKNHLNTNPYVEDYILIKADMYDQYGALIDAEGYCINQDDLNKKDIGELSFNEISKGRYLLNGSECPAFNGQKILIAEVRSGNFAERFNVYMCDIPYESSALDYSYKLKIDGNKVIDTAVTLDEKEPKSTFISVEISKDGYYVGEGIGYWFDSVPDHKKAADFYNVDVGTGFYGMSVEYCADKGDSIYVNDDIPCIVPSYLDLEFIPYSFQEKLPSGEYKISVYNVIAGKDSSKIQLCDSAAILVIDTDPEVDVIQKRQSYTVKPENGWEDVISDYFSFYLEGEDISEYIKKVDCVESSIGTVFVKSVDFLIPNPCFGAFTKTADVERLITKQ